MFGEEAYDVLRVEAGVPRFGAEIDEQVMPAEVGVVDRAVSFTKGCYIGQEPVARLHYRGHANRGLRAILLDGDPARGRRPVQVEGREVGRVTSAVASPTLGRAVALAIVRREVDPGQRVAVVTDGGLLEGERGRSGLPLAPLNVLKVLRATGAVAVLWLVGHALVRGRLPTGLSGLEALAARLVVGLAALSVGSVALADTGLHAPWSVATLAAALVAIGFACNPPPPTPGAGSAGPTPCSPPARW